MAARLRQLSQRMTSVKLKDFRLNFNCRRPHSDRLWGSYSTIHTMSVSTKRSITEVIASTSDIDPNPKGSKRHKSSSSVSDDDGKPSPTEKDTKSFGLIGDYHKYKLISKTQHNHDSVVMRFALQSDDTVLGLPIGNHLRIRWKDDSLKEPIMRSYTPISDDTHIGYFDLLIKVYEHGAMTQRLDKVAIDDHIECTGPLGRIHYNEPSNLKITEGDKVRSLKVSKIGMLAGGTGITPMYQVMQYIHRNREMDKTEISLIFANKTEKDILLKDEFKEMVENNENIKVYHTVEKLEDENQEWDGGIGYISTEMIKENMWEPNDDVVMLHCGPKLFNEAMRKQLMEIGYPENNILKF